MFPRVIDENAVRKVEKRTIFVVDRVLPFQLTRAINDTVVPENHTDAVCGSSYAVLQCLEEVLQEGKIGRLDLIFTELGFRVRV